MLMRDVVNIGPRGWLSHEHAALDLKVVGLSPKLGVEMT